MVVWIKRQMPYIIDKSTVWGMQRDLEIESPCLERIIPLEKVLRGCVWVGWVCFGDVGFWWKMFIHFRWRKSESPSVVSDSLWPHGLFMYSPWNSSGQNTGVGSLSLLQGIFPTQRLNPGLPHWGWILYQLSHKGSPRILEWVAYPFSSGSSWPRNRTGVSCIAGGFFTDWAVRKPLDGGLGVMFGIWAGWIGFSFICSIAHCLIIIAHSVSIFLLRLKALVVGQEMCLVQSCLSCGHNYWHMVGTQ